MTRANSDWWRNTASALFGSIITLMIAWMCMPDFATEDEVRQMIIVQSPYLKDANLIRETQKNNQQALIQLTNNVQELVKTNAELSTKIELLITKPFAGRNKNNE